MGFSIVHTVSGLKELSGGVARSVPGLCDALSDEGCKTILVTQKPRKVTNEVLRLPVSNRVETHLLDGYDWENLRFSFTPRLGRHLESICGGARPCVLHDNGLWLHMNHVAATVAKRLGIKRVVSPRGMLEDWSLRYRGARKKLAWRAYQRRDLELASAFCATSIGEASAIRALGFGQPIAVIPNGIAKPLVGERVSCDGSKRTVLFMSRIHPKKGLLDLIEAWARVLKVGWQLIIAGPDEQGYQRSVEEEARRLRVFDSIKFVGPVEGSAKHDLLRTAEIFVLPSYSENFGIVVGEALSYAVPVVTTTATPWATLQSGRCGWWIETGAGPLEAALSEAMSLSDAERAAMGERGRKLVEREFSWHSVARKHIELYEWLLRGSAPPGWILQ